MDPRYRLRLVTASKTQELEVEVGDRTRYEDLLRPHMDFFDGQAVLARRGNLLHELAERVMPGTSAGAPGAATAKAAGSAASAGAASASASDAAADRLITFYDTGHPDGYRVYMRSLSFVFIRAVYAIEPSWQVLVEHSISGAIYCTLHKEGKMVRVDTDLRNRILAAMRALVDQDLPIRRREVQVEEAMKIFAASGREDKIQLLSYRPGEETAVYNLAGYDDSFYGYMVPSTAYVDTFNLEIFDRGLVLVGPAKNQRGQLANFAPQYKLSDSYNEAEDWSALQGIRQVADLNAMIAAGQIGEVVRVTEALQQHKVMEIAEQIRRENKRVILIAAPSSSGKTSFCRQLITTLRVLGMRPVSISMDDYFVNRADTPKDEAGEFDFESVQALDLAQFNQDMNRLLRGEAVEKLRYDFIAGERVHTGEELQMPGFGPLVIEGIHGLNPLVTQGIDDDWKYKVYLSVTTQINLDDHNRIPTTDLRLMRRMARDMRYRGHSARETLAGWARVRAGEERNIFPYSEEADILFNSSFVYEIAALKPAIEPALQEIGPDEEAYIEANRILSLLRYITPMEDLSDIVNTSILREFLGGSKLI